MTDIRPIHFANSSETAPIHGLFLCRHGDTEKVALRHPMADRYVCPHPSHVTDERSAQVSLDRPQVGGWEVFTLEDAPDALVAADVLAASDEIARLLEGGPLDPMNLLSWCCNAADETLSLAGPVLLQFAPPATRHDFAARLTESSELARRLANAWPGDRSAALLPQLIAWSHDRSPRPIITVGPETTGTIGDHDATVTGRLLSSARAAIKPRHSLAVLSTARNEGIYFLDWIAYHRSIGVEHFFIYSNNNDDASDRLLRSLAERGVITYLPNLVPPDRGAQQQAFGHALFELPEILDYLWTAIIDIDEFIVLNPERFDAMAAFLSLQDARGADTIALNWRMFTSSSQHLFADIPIQERLTRREQELNPHIKSVIRTGRGTNSTPHAPVWAVERPGAAFDAAGHPHHGTNRPLWDSQFRHQADPGPAWINHYLLRSLPEYVWKAARNRGDAASSLLRFPTDHIFLGHFLAWHDNPASVEDTTVLSRTGDFRKERKQLESLPGIADAHAECLDIFSRTVVGLMQDILARADEIAAPHRAPFIALLKRSLDEGVVVSSKAR